MEDRCVGGGENLDGLRIGEGERHLEQSWATEDLQREPVDAVTTNPRRMNLDADPEPPLRRHLGRLRLDADLQIRRGNDPEFTVASRARISVADLREELEAATPRDPSYPLGFGPQHLEPGSSNASDAQLGDRARNQHASEQSGAEPDGRGHLGDEPRHQGRQASPHELSAGAGGMNLHGETIAKAPRPFDEGEPPARAGRREKSLGKRSRRTTRACRLRPLPRRLPLFLVLWTALLAAALAVTPARAEHAMSELERSVVAQALADQGWERELAPEGKWIEQIEVYAIDVFDDRDPVPNVLNVLHVTSQDYVIRRELLFRVGMRFDPVRIQETERNLRALRQLSLVILVAAQGSSPDRVRVLAIVKDTWSLRLNTNWALGAGTFEYLLLNPSEENLFGTHTSVGLLYVLERDRYSAGGRFVNRRVGGSRLWLGTQATVSFNRHTGEGEGSAGQFIFEQPLYSLRSEWAFSSRVAWRREVTRWYRGSDIALVPVDTADGTELVPFLYDTDRLAAEYWGVRSFGRTYKFDLTFGAEAVRGRHRELDMEGFSPAVREAFREQALPVDDVRISPFLQLRAYTSRFHRTLNLELLGLQEDFRLGHDAMLRVYPASRALGSTRTLLGVLAELGYTVPLGDGLARAVVSSDIVVADEARHEALFWAGARLATPTFASGLRLHVDGVVAHRYQNYLNVPPFFLGGNGRLRGYVADDIRGRDMAVANVELRTRPIDVLSAQLGGAVFYDVGDAGDSLGVLEPKQGVGMGARILFPQTERLVMRLDWAMPLNGPSEPLPGAFFVTFGQAFAMPRVLQPSVTSVTSSTGAF